MATTVDTEDPELDQQDQEDPTQDPNQDGIDPSQQDQSVQDNTNQPDPEQQKADAEAEQEDLERILMSLFTYAEKEDEDLRFNLIRTWKRNDYYFNNIQKIFFDETAKDYRSIDAIANELANMNGVDDIKIINVYRATAESLVAALSVALPAVEFTPDDAEDPNDLETADAYSRIAELVSRHNHAQLMLIKALTLLYNSGVVFGYNYYRTDPAYGTIERPGKTVPKPVMKADVHCATCGETIDTNVDPTQINPKAPVTCPTCGANLPPHIVPKTIEFVDEVVEYEKTPKGRSCFDIFGPTHVKAPLYSRNQDGLPYLILRIEDHVAKFKTVYNDKKDKISTGGGDTYSYERWGRIPPEYYGTIPKDITTLRTGWFRPWFYNSPCLNEDDAAKLVEKYPDGVMVSVIGDSIVDIQDEKLDDRWDVSFDPRANFIHAEPEGNAMIPLQDSETDIFNLGLQSIEYGIPETFAHPKTLAFDKYGQTRNMPGMITAAKPFAADKNLSDSFFTLKTATLSSEYTNFAGGLKTTREFVSGNIPSLFGGTAEGQPQTATQYTESKNRALQRRQLTWQMISVFWCNLIYKCTRNFAQNLRDDESYATKENGTFVNVWIRTSQLRGSVGHVEPEINGQIPQSWSQKKDFMMSLIAMVPNSPELGAILLNPNNTEILKDITGMPDFYIPGENDRNKQWAEYYILSKSQPNGKQPSLLPDIDVDDHAVHMQVLKNILVSPLGMKLYQIDPAGYQNNIAHYRAHEMMLQAKTMAPAGGSGENQPPPSATNTTAS